jgi:anti-sigma-K factor RskA
MDPHELTAAYALHALEPDEAEAYERHLSRCEECREQLAELSETSAALAYAPVAPAPPPRLRAAILETAAAERSNVVPLVRRSPWVSRGLAIAAAAVACVAVGLGVALSQSSKPQRSWTVSVGPTGQATLSVSGLAAAPSGKTYEAWIIPAGKAPQPAGLFPGSMNAVRLSGMVPKHAVVAVTVEPAGGSTKPTTTPIFSTRT